LLDACSLAKGIAMLGGWAMALLRHRRFLVDTNRVDDFDDFWEKHPDPTDDEIAAMCHAWATYQRETRQQEAERSPPSGADVLVGQSDGVGHAHREADDNGDGPEHPLWWAAQAVQDAGFQGLGVLWRVIRCQCAVADPNDEWVICMIGAGSLEDAFFTYGDEAMDLIEPAAEHDPVLLQALENVWCWNTPIRPRLDALLERHRRGRTA
jgi:hypothetical protein